jgi:large subunit ribosomal protein L1
MGRLTKNRKAALEKYDLEQTYSIDDAAGMVKAMTSTKFDASVDIAVRLGEIGRASCRERVY